MRKFFKTIASHAATVAAVTILGASMARCTEVDDSIGRNFVPVNQTTVMRIDTLTSFKSYVARTDTIASAKTGRLVMGSMEDDVFGRTLCGFMSHIFPPNANFNNDNYFGFNPQVDSVKIELYITDVFGNPEPEQTFNIYALKDSLKKDSLYFYNIPIERVVDFDKPLFSFKLKDEKRRTVVNRRLEVTADGAEYLSKLANTDNEVWQDPYYKFHENFYGFYIAPAEDSEPDAAVYEMNLRATSTYFSTSSFIVYSHNHDPEQPAMNKDTLGIYFRFNDEEYPNLNVNKATHIYPSELQAAINDTMQTSTPLSAVYVQGLGGVATYLKVTDEFMTQLEALKTYNGVAYRDIIINQAHLYMPLGDPTTENMDKAPSGLGIYYDYRQYLATPSLYTGPIPIYDYNYMLEGNQSTSGVIRFGGDLNRSNGYYRMDITGYITRLLTHPGVDPRNLWLGPEVVNRNKIYTQVALKGSERPDNPIKLVLTYTLVR